MKVLLTWNMRTLHPIFLNITSTLVRETRRGRTPAVGKQTSSPSWTATPQLLAPRFGQPSSYWWTSSYVASKKGLILALKIKRISESQKESRCWMNFSLFSRMASAHTCSYSIQSKRKPWPDRTRFPSSPLLSCRGCHTGVPWSAFSLCPTTPSSWPEKTEQFISGPCSWSWKEERGFLYVIFIW